MKAWLLALRHNGAQLFIAVDQFGNVLLSVLLMLLFLSRSKAWADETLSCRAWRAETRGLLPGRAFRPVIDLLFSWQHIDPPATGHCHQAYLRERARAGLPPEFRS